MNLDPFLPAEKKLRAATNEAEKIEAAKQALKIGICLSVICAALLALGLFLLLVVAPSLSR